MADNQKIRGDSLLSESADHQRRDLKWEECGIEEKVERLREELRGHRWALQQAQNEAHILQEHEHNAKGEIVVPLRSKRGYGVEARTRDMLA